MSSFKSSSSESHNVAQRTYPAMLRPEKADFEIVQLLATPGLGDRQFSVSFGLATENATPVDG